MKGNKIATVAVIEIESDFLTNFFALIVLISAPRITHMLILRYKGKSFQYHNLERLERK